MGNIGGVEIASLPVNPWTQPLAFIQEALSHELSVSQARLRLLLPGSGRLPTESENRAPLADLFGIVHLPGNLVEGLEMADSSLQGKKQGYVDEEDGSAETSPDHLALNDCKKKGWCLNCASCRGP